MLRVTRAGIESCPAHHNLRAVSAAQSDDEHGEYTPARHGLFEKEIEMAYRNLTQKQFNLVKEAAAERCKAEGRKTVGEYKRIGNDIIDQIESGEITWVDLLA